MTDSKNFLNVPYAQKDEAKLLGARWDALEKKWFVPADKDSALFVRWQAKADAVSPRSTKATSASSTNRAGIITRATDQHFVAYNGDLPPW